MDRGSGWAPLASAVRSFPVAPRLIGRGPGVAPEAGRIAGLEHELVTGCFGSFQDPLLHVLVVKQTRVQSLRTGKQTVMNIQGDTEIGVPEQRVLE